MSLAIHIFEAIILIAVVVYIISIIGRSPKFHSIAKKLEDAERRSESKVKYQRERLRIVKRLQSIQESYSTRTDADGMLLYLALSEVSNLMPDSAEWESFAAEIVERFDHDPIEAEKTIVTSVQEHPQTWFAELAKHLKK